MYKIIALNWFNIVTPISNDREHRPSIFMSKVEATYPGAVFSHSYRLSRLFGLTPDQKSFLFKLLQKAQTPACLFCDVQVDAVDHVLTSPQSTEVATPILASMASQVDH